MVVSKNNTKKPFPANVFSIKMIISNFHFSLNTYLNFPLIFWVLTSLPKLDISKLGW